MGLGSGCARAPAHLHVRIRIVDRWRNAVEEAACDKPTEREELKVCNGQRIANSEPGRVAGGVVEVVRW